MKIWVKIFCGILRGFSARFGGEEMDENEIAAISSSSSSSSSLRCLCCGGEWKMEVNYLFCF